MIDRRRAERWLVVLVAALAVILGISISALARTTSTDAGSFTYDAPAVTRVDARAFSDATAGGAQLGGARERHASLSRPAQGAATTPLRRSHATNTADDALRAADDVAQYGSTPAGRPYTRHYGTETGPQRNIPGSVADEAIDHHPGKLIDGGKSVHYDPVNDITVVTGNGQSIFSVHRGPPRAGQR